MSQEATSWISQQVWSFLVLDGRVVVMLFIGQESSTKGLSCRPGIWVTRSSGNCGPRNPLSSNIVVSLIIGCAPPLDLDLCWALRALSLHRWIGIWQTAILWRAACWLNRELPSQRGYQCKLLRLFVVANWSLLTCPPSKASQIQTLARQMQITCIRRLC